jgi:hypothetical protein
VFVLSNQAAATLLVSLSIRAERIRAATTLRLHPWVCIGHVNWRPHQNQEAARQQGFPSMPSSPTVVVTTGVAAQTNDVCDAGACAGRELVA